MALAGIAGGWLLKTATDLASEWKTGRLAARAIYLEMTANLIALTHFREMAIWTQGEGPQHKRWDTQGPQLMGIADEETVSAVASCYAQLEHVRRMLLVLAEPREQSKSDQDEPFEPLKITVRGVDLTVNDAAVAAILTEEGGSLEKTVATIEATRRRVGRLMYPPWRRGRRREAEAGTLRFGTPLSLLAEDPAGSRYSSYGPDTWHSTQGCDETSRGRPKT